MAEAALINAVGRLLVLASMAAAAALRDGPYQKTGDGGITEHPPSSYERLSAASRFESTPSCAMTTVPDG